MNGLNVYFRPWLELTLLQLLVEKRQRRRLFLTVFATSSKAKIFTVAGSQHSASASRIGPSPS